ncbi:15781_t:CDS:2, partial [Gigaspora margarita]
MSTSISSLPAINIIEGWDTETLIGFLNEQNLKLKEDHFEVLRKQEIDGEVFLRLNVDKLIVHPYKLPGGPAEKISKLIERIKGEGQGQKKEADVILTTDGKILQYYQLYKNEHSEATDKEIRSDFMDFISQYVPEYPKDSYEDVVKAFQESPEKASKPSYRLRREEDEEIVQKAFNRTFQDPSNLSERFIQFIDKCLYEYETTIDTYYAPYTTLIQASGVGKSKLLINVAEKIMTVYCCLRDFKSSGYPSRSYIAKILVNKFENEREAEVTYLAYICASFQKVQEFDGDFKKWIDGLINKNSQKNFWKDVEDEMKNIKHHLMKCSGDSETSKWVEKYLDSVENKKIKRKGSVKYLFAFDEARILVSENVEKQSLFYCMRRALILLPKRAGIFAIFTDTHSNLSNFSPVSYRDPSLTVAEGGSQLFEPFYLLDTVDMNVNFKKVMTLKESEDPQHFFQYGRPLWGALLSPPNETKGMKPEHIVELAMDKLIGGENFSIWRKKIQNKIGILETLAILGPRLCIEIVPQSRVASSLVANNLRLCINILEDREYVVTSMPTEPLLAEASARIMNDPYISPIELINQLSSALKKGIVEAGYRGELTARLLLLNAWDRCIKKKSIDDRKKDFNDTNASENYFRFVTIEEFLRSLLADNVYEKIENRLEKKVEFTGRKFCEAYVKFTHFINITYTPDRKDLGDALIRGVAFSCKRNQQGVDIIIPTYMGTLDETINEDRISYILIQVKNHSTNNKGHGYLKSATTMLSPAYIGIEDLPHMPFLSLYLQLGAKSELSDVPNSESTKTRNMTSCKRKIAEVLEDYKTDAKETRKEFIKKIRLENKEDSSAS